MVTGEGFLGLVCCQWSESDEPGGLPEISRGASAAPPPVIGNEYFCAPAGAWEISFHSIRRAIRGGKFILHMTGGRNGSTVLPPANVQNPSGICPRSMPQNNGVQRHAGHAGWLFHLDPGNAQVVVEFTVAGEFFDFVDQLGEQFTGGQV